VEFLRNASEGTYDAIIVDSSDPIGELMLQCIVILENSAMESFSYVLVLYICSMAFIFASYYIIAELCASLFLLGYCSSSCSGLMMKILQNIFLQKEL
jgi:hypothetical protein